MKFDLAMEKFCTFLAIALLSLITSASAQNQPAWDRDQSIRDAKSQLALEAAPEGSLYIFCEKNQIKGEFIVDIAVQGKGEITTVFLVSSSTDDVRSKNLVKDKLAELKLKEIRIPKNERIKFRYTLNF